MDQETPYCISFLRRELHERSARNTSYSLRCFSRDLGVNVSALSRILNGKLKLSLKSANKICQRLNLIDDTKDNFMFSVVKQSEDYTETINNASPESEEVNQEIFEVIQNWYHYAILELTQTETCISTPKWMAGQLGISEINAKLAIERLVACGLLKWEEGRLQKTFRNITTKDKQKTSAAHKEQQREFREKAITSLLNDPIETRSMTTMTMAIDPELLPMAKKEILKFQKYLCKKLESGKRLQVYTLEVSLFPIQKTNTYYNEKDAPHANYQ